MYNIHRRNFTLRGGAPCTPLASIPLKEGRNMEHTIGFPNLGLEFTLSRVACTVLGKDIYWYGIIICAGFILAALYVNSRTKDFGITSDNLTDCLIICVPLGIICARIYYVVFEWGYYAQHPGEIIAIWKGGIAIYGGIIGTFSCTAGSRSCRLRACATLRRSACSSASASAAGAISSTARPTAARRPSPGA